MGESLIREQDTRAIVRLLSKVAVLDGSLKDKRQQLLKELGALIGANAWFWVDIVGADAAPDLRFSLGLSAGVTDEQLGYFLRSQEHPDMAKLNGPILAEFSEKRHQLTRSRTQMDPEGRVTSMEIDKLWQKSDLGPVIASYVPSGTDSVCVAFFRHYDDAEFDERETRLAHILLSEVPWLFADPAEAMTHPRRTLFKLTPRLNATLNLCLQGFSRKEIAEHLKVSIHTANDYVKELYHRFKVHSQRELVRRFHEGDGRDTPL